LWVANHDVPLGLRQVLKQHLLVQASWDGIDKLRASQTKNDKQQRETDQNPTFKMARRHRCANREAYGRHAGNETDPSGNVRPA
jgi:hypothetical protein